MTLQASGAISLNDINVEFALGTNLNAYRGVSHTTGTFPSGTIAFNDFYSKTKVPSVTFTPAGSTSSGSRTAISSSASDAAATYTLTCSTTATWTYTRISGTAGSANVASGGSSAAIRFTLTPPAIVGTRTSIWNIDGSASGVTNYWQLTLTADKTSGGCPTCCFTPDTLIRMADMTEKPISEVQVGDYILVFDEITNTNVAVPVSEIIVREDRVMYEMVFDDGTTLNASEDHPIYVIGKGYSSVNPSVIYKDAGIPNRIEVGDRVSTVFGTAPMLISIRQIDFPGQVYTFGNSKFYANSILVY